MANEDRSEDRLTRNEFAELIQHLSVQEILAIEYRISSNWNKLFLRKNFPQVYFFCNLCVLETSSFKNLLAHIDGRKHKLQMERVKQLYHKDYTYPKNDKKDGPEKILSEKNEDYTASSVLKQTIALGDSDKEKLQSIEDNKPINVKISGNKETNKTADSLKTVKETGEDFSGNKKNRERSSLDTNYISEVKNVSAQRQKQDKSRSDDETLKLVSKETNNITTKNAKKRLPADNTEDIDIKKPKIVVNPAAAISSKAGTMKNENHHYQTDKIIIPTVHRNKFETDKNVHQSTLKINSDIPKFSVKSYSSKPSDNDVHGILGVEYVIKILKNRSDVSPRYECGLCELVFDGLAMQRHLEGYNHRLMFCEKHFPTAIRQYRQYMQNVPESEIFKVMAPVLAKLAVAIEQHHGRNLPYECFEREFSLNRHEILAKAFSCRHASEQYGPTFTHVVGSKEIDELINNRHMYMPAPFSRAAIFDVKHVGTGIKSNYRNQNCKNIDKESHSRDRHRNAGRENVKSDGTIYRTYMSSGLHEDVYQPTNIYKQKDDINTVKHLDDETYNLMVDDFLKETLKGFSRNNTLRDNRKRSLSPVRNSSSVIRKSLSPLRQNDIWQAYRHMVDQELYKLDERFKEYRKDPETHPSYNEEWQKFWKRRKDELVSTGLDHRKYNYQPEWVRFVKIRIEELYGQEVENLKIKSRERLCLPLTNEDIPDVKYHVQAPNIKTPRNSQSTIDIISNITSLQFANNVPQVVSVLRLMTALEDSLGSLGPKITNLLSKALQSEKTNPLYVNAIILDEENCSLIETAKEKFKGLIITGLFEGSKKKVLNQVVNDAEELLRYAYQFKQQLASERFSVESATSRTQKNLSASVDFAHTGVSNTSKNEIVRSNFSDKRPLSSSSLLTENSLTFVDKKELASKLAASLVSQGKTDFDPHQLQQLIAVYKLIEKKKHESTGTSLSTKEIASSAKRALSDTLSDILKVSSASACISNISNESQSAFGSSNQKPAGNKSIASVVYGNSTPSNSFTSVLQNYSSSYFNNTAVSNAFVASGEGGNQLEERSNYGVNCTNYTNQQMSNLSNVYHDQYQYNNRMTQQNWGLNANIEMDQTHNMARSNNNINQTSNWPNF